MFWKPSTLFIVWLLFCCEPLGCQACSTRCSCSVKAKDSNEKTSPVKMICKQEPKLKSLAELNLTDVAADIQFLDISGNELESIQSDDFTKLPSLQRLNLSGNSIANIELDAFQSLTNLDRLDLSFNRIVSLTNRTFSGLRSLDRLYLAGNQISTIPDGAFDPLFNLRRLSLQSNPLLCDCRLSWLPTWMLLNNIRLMSAATCQTPAEQQGIPLTDFTCDHASVTPNITLTPSSDQLVLQGDKLRLRCKASVVNYNLTLTWFHEKRDVRKNKESGVLVHHDTLPDGALETQLVIANVTSSDAGVWQCRLSTVHGATKRLQLTVRVLDASLVRCPQYTVTTSKGAFAWAATPVNTSVSQPCPHGGSGHSHAGIYCNSDGQWTGLDVTQCQYTSDVTAKLEQYSQEDFHNVNQSQLMQFAMTSKIHDYVTHPEWIVDADAVIFMAQTIDNFVEQTRPTKPLGELVIRLVSMIMDVDAKLLYEAQEKSGALSKMVRAVEKLTHALLTNDKQARDVTVFAKNIAIHAFVVPASKFKGLECAMMTSPVNEVKVKDANDPGYTAGTLECVIPGQTTFSSHITASVRLPANLLRSIRCTDGAPCASDKAHEIQIIVYHNAALFPLRNQTTERRVLTPVISSSVAVVMGKFSVNEQVGNLSQPIEIRLRSRHVAYEQTAVYWVEKSSGNFGAWYEDGCDVTDHKDFITSIQCNHLTSFAVLQSLEAPAARTTDDVTWLSRAFSMSVQAYIGSLILTVCVGASLFSYIAFRRYISMPRKLRHCIPNLCVAMLLLCLVFTFGVHSRRPPLLCRIVGILLHYLTVCILLWIAVTAYIYYKKLRRCWQPAVNQDDVDAGAPAAAKPVLGLYLIGWGLGSILCGIVAAINSLEHYDNQEYCFLTPDSQVLAFFIPVLFVLIINLIVLFCICCTVHSRTSATTTASYIASPSAPSAAAEFATAAAENDDNETNIADDDVTSSLRHTPQLLQQQQPLSLDVSSVAPTANNRSVDVSASLSGRSELDLQYKPTNQVLGMALILLLFLVTWACAALSVARPFELHLQDDLFNCFYMLSSAALGVFIFVFFVLCRADVRRSWHYTCCCVKQYSDAFDDAGSSVFVGASRTVSSMRTLTPPPTTTQAVMTSYLNGHAGHRSSSSMTNGMSHQHLSRPPPLAPATVTVPPHAALTYNTAVPAPLTSTDHPYSYQPLPVPANDHPLMFSSSVQSVPPATATESSFTAVSQQQQQQEYPNFYNARQNGVARKYWRKKRMKQSLIEANREFYKRGSDYDSDVTNPMLLKHRQQLQQQKDSARGSELPLTPQVYMSQFTPPPSERSGKLGPPMSREEQYELSPMVGLSSPPSVLQTDGANSCVTDSGVHDDSAAARRSDVTVFPPPPLTSPNNSSQSLTRAAAAAATAAAPQPINLNQYLLRHNAETVAVEAPYAQQSRDVFRPGYLTAQSTALGTACARNDAGASLPRQAHNGANLSSYGTPDDIPRLANTNSNNSSVLREAGVARLADANDVLNECVTTDSNVVSTDITGSANTRNNARGGASGHLISSEMYRPHQAVLAARCQLKSQSNRFESVPSCQESELRISAPTEHIDSNECHSNGNSQTSSVPVLTQVPKHYANRSHNNDTEANSEVWVRLKAAELASPSRESSF